MDSSETTNAAPADSVSVSEPAPEIPGLKVFEILFRHRDPSVNSSDTARMSTDGAQAAGEPSNAVAAPADATGAVASNATTVVPPVTTQAAPATATPAEAQPVKAPKKPRMMKVRSVLDASWVSASLTSSLAPPRRSSSPIRRKPVVRRPWRRYDVECQREGEPYSFVVVSRGVVSSVLLAAPASTAGAAKLGRWTSNRRCLGWEGDRSRRKRYGPTVVDGLSARLRSICARTLLGKGSCGGGLVVWSGGVLR